MRPFSAFRHVRGGLAVALWAMLAMAGGTGSAAGATLYEGGGKWAVASGIPEAASPPGSGWGFEKGLWIGRVSAPADSIAFGDVVLPLSEALPLPLAPARLPLTSNPFGPCVVKSLSVRFDSQLQGRRWSPVFPAEDGRPALAPIEILDGHKMGLALFLEDVDTGQRQELVPDRMGREGGMFADKKGLVLFYSGLLEDGQVEWKLLVSPEATGRHLLQGQVRSLDGQDRRLRFRVLMRTGEPGRFVLQDDLPPAVLIQTGTVAVALFADLAEPRRFRGAFDEACGATGLEFDLALTKTTGNFPNSATFSVAVEAWNSTDPEAAQQEALERLARTGGSMAVPEWVVREGIPETALFEPCFMRLRHPGGFESRSDAQRYLSLRTSGLFSDSDWASSALQCGAQDAEEALQIELREGEGARVSVNADPDLETLLEWGQNRGKTVLDQVRRRELSVVFLRASGGQLGLDHRPNALYLCDYPALWDEGSAAIGVDLRHAEVELITALACVFKEEGICLLVGDAGPLAPFTTMHADALVCESMEPAEMRRQRMLAGTRPVLWRVEAADAAAEELAQHLGFVRLPGIKEN